MSHSHFRSCEMETGNEVTKLEAVHSRRLSEKSSYGGILNYALDCFMPQ